MALGVNRISMVHSYNFKLVRSRHGKGSHLAQQVFRDDRATAAIRRYMPLHAFAAVERVIQKKRRAKCQNSKRR
jgi:hypothetical protein